MSSLQIESLNRHVKELLIRNGVRIPETLTKESAHTLIKKYEELRGSCLSRDVFNELKQHLVDISATSKDKKVSITEKTAGRILAGLTDYSSLMEAEDCTDDEDEMSEAEDDEDSDMKDESEDSENEEDEKSDDSEEGDKKEEMDTDSGKSDKPSDDEEELEEEESEEKKDKVSVKVNEPVSVEGKNGTILAIDEESNKVTVSFPKEGEDPEVKEYSQDDLEPAMKDDSEEKKTEAGEVNPTDTPIDKVKKDVEKEEEDNPSTYESNGDDVPPSEMSVGTAVRYDGNKRGVVTAIGKGSSAGLVTVKLDTGAVVTSGLDDFEFITQDKDASKIAATKKNEAEDEEQKEPPADAVEGDEASDEVISDYEDERDAKNKKPDSRSPEMKVADALTQSEHTIRALRNLVEELSSAGEETSVDTEEGPGENLEDDKLKKEPKDSEIKEDPAASKDMPVPSEDGTKGAVVKDTDPVDSKVDKVKKDSEKEEDKNPTNFESTKLNEELSNNDILNQLRSLASKPGAYVWIRDVYTSEFVFSKNGDEGEKLFKQSYIINDDSVELVGDPVEVVQKTEYSPKSENLSNFGDKKAEPFTSDDAADARKKKEMKKGREQANDYEDSDKMSMESKTVTLEQAKWFLRGVFGSLKIVPEMNLESQIVKFNSKLNIEEFKEAAVAAKFIVKSGSEYTAGSALTEG